MLKNAFLLLLLAGASFAWWDASFSHRVPIIVSNPGEALTDYQINLTIPYDTDMQSDFDDLRFSLNNTELPYWLENKTDGVSAKAWVKVPILPSGDSSIHMYYGDALVTYNNSLGGSNTFDFFDDFDGISLDANKWARYDDYPAEQATFTFGNSALIVTTSSSSLSNGGGIYSKFAVSPAHAVMSRYTTATETNWLSTLSLTNSIVTWDDYFADQGHPRSNGGATRVNLVTGGTGGAYNGALVFDPVASVFYKHELRWGNASAKMFIDNSQYDSAPYTYAGNLNISWYSRRGYSGASGVVAKLDYIAVRAYVPDAPIISFGGEEEIPRQFQHMQPIILNNSGSAISDYQVNLIINTTSLILAGKMNSSCSDLRFTNSTSYNTQDWTTSYKYWIESGCNTTATRIWVNVPSISNGTSTIFTYYGNISAVSGTNGNATFEFFDDFIGSSVDTSKWTVDGAGGLSVSSSEAVMVQAGGKIRSVKTLSQPFIIETKLRSLIGTTGQGFSAIGTWASTSSGYGLQAYGTPGGSMYRFNNGAWGAITSYTVDANPRIYRMTAANAAVNLSILPLNRSTVEWTYSEAYAVSSQQIRVGQRYDNGGTTEAQDERWDWVLVRKYASPEPAASFGTEQQPDTTAPSVQIQSPTSQTYNTSTVNVNFTATDNTGVSSCTVRLNGTINSSTCSNYTITLANGAYNLTVTVNDTAGNINSSQALFTIATDTIPPSISIQSPTNITYTTGTIPVTYTAADNTAVDSCTVTLNGTLNSSTCSNYTLTLANGAYTLNVTANDTAGNMNSTQVPFTVAIPAGLQINTTQATTDSSGIAVGNISFAFTPATLKISTGTHETIKAIKRSANVNRIEIKAKITLSGQPATGKQVTYALSE
jgi:Domain of unknown function (DUF2341)/Bacterial Ig domain